MEKIKVENWNGCNIRFVEFDGEWWAVAKDITAALGFEKSHDSIKVISDKYKAKYLLECEGNKSRITSRARKTQNVTIINEIGIYRLIMRSNKPEAEAFQEWVFSILKGMRQQSGLQGFEIFRMLDKEHQREQMKVLQQSRRNAVPVDFIKANTIANKAVSNAYGYGKMVRKAEMTPEMLVAREPILEDTVELMGVKDKYDLDISVSDAIYAKTAGSGRIS